jgi:lysophospholipase L1-like esterase
MKTRLAFHLRLFLVTLLFGLLAAGCGNEQLPKLQTLSEDAVILAFGDSLTFGTGAQKLSDSYPAVLAQLSGRQVINAGRPGEVSAEGLQRIEHYLAEQRPDLVILCHGGNDLLRKLDITQLRENLSGMINKIQQSGAEVVLVSVPKPALWLEPAPIYLELARQHGLVIENNIIADIASKADLKSDQIHPNSDGYQRLAEAIYELLISAGAL